MNIETKKKLVELGFTEDKPGHFALSRCGYTFNAYVKSENSNNIWMGFQYDNGANVGWTLSDLPEAVAAATKYFNDFIDLNVSRKSKAD